MRIDIELILAVLALICTVISAVKPRLPLWVAVLLLCLAFLSPLVR